MFQRVFRLVILAACVLELSRFSLPAAPPEPLEIRESISLDPTKTYGPLKIVAPGVVIDGRGATILGAVEGPTNTFRGTAISADGVSRVTLKNIKAKGFETGLRVKNAEGWLIEGCDFSDNFHDPEFGWGEQGRRGGIVLEGVKKSMLKKNRAERVWDACVLIDCDDNILEGNHFSKTSNTSLKLWHSCRNSIQKNVLSYGLRIKPGEVHARDSTSVLIESGSNGNNFTENDCTHGGDGIFVRVLNGWVSTDNTFEKNDCSYANNNGIECWAPRNTWVRNVANRCSYGFWLGGSDQTRLIENEASFNGDPQGFHNSPHLPADGHAGIVFLFGSSSHTICRGNICRGNNGAGIALVGDQGAGKQWKAYHWILEQNRLEDNRWGVFVQNADWIEMRGNLFKNNRQGNLRSDGGVTRLMVSDALVNGEPPAARLVGPTSAVVNEPVEFSAAGSQDPVGKPLLFAWDLGDGSQDANPLVKHRYSRPGFFRVGVTVQNGERADLAWRDFYVIEDLPEPATEGQAKQWDWVHEDRLAMAFRDDPEIKLAGKSSVSVLIDPYHGVRASLLYPKSRQAGWSLEKPRRLTFWLKTINQNLPGWQDVNPVVTLYESDKAFVKLTPVNDLLSQPSYPEAREGWRHFEIPLAGDKVWKREGAEIRTVNWLTIGVDSWDAQPLRLWIDGLSLTP